MKITSYKRLLHFDIETVAEYQNFKTFKENDKRGADLFEKKFKNNTYLYSTFKNVHDCYEKNAPLMPAYNKIVCLSFAYYTSTGAKQVRSLFNDNEEELIMEIAEFFNKVGEKKMIPCGFRILGFDIPVLNHKFNKFNIKIPYTLRIYGKKPWELNCIDLANEIKGGMTHYLSFDEVAYMFGIDSPKDDINGSQVHEVYWVEKDLKRIVTYCEKDALSNMLVAEKMFTDNLD